MDPGLAPASNQSRIPLSITSCPGYHSTFHGLLYLHSALQRLRDPAAPLISGSEVLDPLTPASVRIQFRIARPGLQSFPGLMPCTLPGITRCILPDITPRILPA
ncbi:acetoin utilization protein AcuC [Platysternon megacephalum]|uniref:Acetoin utilization protein AcuC n=1 Tax=Platysternon megacephalum TaxID=55544 RepID=A0A4D9DM85_9SAUR|nr:acetoin utilization protein AcuC [Platysternon megacephalum]